MFVVTEMCYRCFCCALNDATNVLHAVLDFSELSAVPATFLVTNIWSKRASSGPVTCHVSSVIWRKFKRENVGKKFPRRYKGTCPKKIHVRRGEGVGENRYFFVRPGAVGKLINTRIRGDPRISADTEIHYPRIVYIQLNLACSSVYSSIR